jgi:hypothetical protein
LHFFMKVTSSCERQLDVKELAYWEQ